MSYSIDYRTFSSIFAVPSQVIDQGLTSCTGDALKVLLLILRDPQKPVDPARLAGQLGLSIAGVQQALDYWTGAGILSQAPDALSAAARQLSLEEPSLPSPAAFSQQQRERVAVISGKKNMTIGEITALSQSDPNIPGIIAEAQRQLGRDLSRTETETLVSFYSYAGLSPEYIALAIAYCCELGKSSVSYIAKTINDWVSKEIDTYEKAESHIVTLTQAGSDESQVKSAFGIFDRALTAQEKRYIHTWFHQYHFDIAVIRLAYERTIDNIGKLSFPYINSILSSWHSKGITTTREAAQESSAKPSAKGGSGGLSSSIDLEELEYFLSHGKSPV